MHTVNRVAALVATLASALALLASVIAMPSAEAQEATGTLTILKHVGEGEFEKLGTPQPLAGVTFRVDKLKDITPQSQQELGQLVQKNPYLLTNEKQYFEDPAVNAQAITGADGRATFDSLPTGVYLVQELPYRTGNIQYSAITPFLVSIPDGPGNRNVEVKAKNQPITAEKFAKVEQTDAGNIVTFNIRTEVPAPDTRGKLYQMIIQDDLDQRLSLAGLPIVTIANGIESQRLEENIDYSFRHDPVAHEISVELTEEGLKKLAAVRQGHPEAQLEVAIATKLQEGLPAGTVINNTAFAFPDGWPTEVLSNDLTNGIPTNEASIIVHGGVITPQPPAPTAPMVLWPIFPAHAWPDFKPCPNCQVAPAVNHPAQPGLIDQIINKVTGAKGEDQNKPRLERLANTGASVIGVAIVAILALLIGWWLLIWRRTKNKDEDTEEGAPQ